MWQSSIAISASQREKKFDYFSEVEVIAFKELLMLMSLSSIYHAQIIPFWNFI